MSQPFEPFIRRFLAFGAIGGALGLSAVSLTPANQGQPDAQAQQSFSARLQTVRSAVSLSDTAGTVMKRPVAEQFRNID